jgi:hypothetical protein
LLPTTPLEPTHCRYPLQPDFSKAGLNGTIGAVIHLSFANNMAHKDSNNEDYDATASDIYILTAAHVAYSLFIGVEDQLKYRFKIEDQLNKFNEKSVFASYFCNNKWGCMDYAFLPCTEEYEASLPCSVVFEKITPLFGPLKYGNLNNWDKIWPNMAYFASKNCIVCKKGKKTGVTCGNLQFFPHKESGIFEVVGIDNDFSDHGDSGALVFLLVPHNWPYEAGTLFPVGLHVIGDVSKHGKKYSRFISLLELFKHFCERQAITQSDKKLEITFKNPQLEGKIHFSLGHVPKILPKVYPKGSNIHKKK